MSALPCLITGGGGQLGRDLGRLLPGSPAPSKADLSVLDLDALRRAIVQAGAQTVFNCAAYNAVDRAEQEVELAMAVNARGAGNVAKACRLEGARLVHFSTNYVFDGSSDSPYTEEDAPNPISAYGRSKREGELAVHAELPEALVIRSSGLYGRGGSAVKGGSLPDRLLSRARSGLPLSVVVDQTFNPTYTAHLAVAAIEVERSRTSGLLHLVAAGCCTVHEFAQEVVRLAGLDVAVEAIDTPPGGAPRPAHGCLASVRTEPLPHWRQGLAEYWRARPAEPA